MGYPSRYHCSEVGVCSTHSEREQGEWGDGALKEDKRLGCLKQAELAAAVQPAHGDAPLASHLEARHAVPVNVQPHPGGHAARRVQRPALAACGLVGSARRGEPCKPLSHASEPMVWGVLGTLRVGPVAPQGSPSAPLSSPAHPRAAYSMLRWQRGPRASWRRCEAAPPPATCRRVPSGGQGRRSLHCRSTREHTRGGRDRLPPGTQ